MYLYSNYIAGCLHCVHTEQSMPLNVLLPAGGVADGEKLKARLSKREKLEARLGKREKLEARLSKREKLEARLGKRAGLRACWRASAQACKGGRLGVTCGQLAAQLPVIIGQLV
jgi:hypothetical protein